jgi:hypothetical protein
MATTAPTNRGPGQSEYSPTAIGITVFAGVLMIMTGVFHAVQGLVALFNDTFFVYGQEYVFKFDVTGWGWAHLILGIVVALAGFALFQGATWARTVAVIVACVSVLASFLWLPYYPIWSLVVIAFDVFVIWAVTAHGRDITKA